MTIEKRLGYLAGDDHDSRVELVQVAERAQVPTLELRYQSECGALGWVTQKRIRIAAGQIADLRHALNRMDLDAREARISASRRGRAHSLNLVDSAANE